MMVKCGEWVTDRVPTEEEIKYAGDTGFILCVSGKEGAVIYDHAVVLSEFNEFYEGEWYINGVRSDLEIHGWMMPPDAI